MKHYDIIIVGSGPAGLTAALYAARSDRSVIIFEGHQPGGQLTITTEVENFPGFEHGIQGPELMDVMRKQVHRFGAESSYTTITNVDFANRPFVVTNDRDEQFSGDSLILSTGATARWLGAENEEDFKGYGISACATCDGFFFKDMDVMVVGGGDSAMEEADFLTKYANKVTIVHRREEYRASKIMLQRARDNEKIEFLENTVIASYDGEKNNGIPKLTGVTLKDTQTGETRKQDIQGVFMGIGHTPNTQLFEGVLDLDDSGYIKTIPGTTRTNVEGVFACGDVQDSIYRQAITAAGTGCMAALDADRWLAENK